MQGAQVRSLVRELRSHVPLDVAKKINEILFLANKRKKRFKCRLFCRLLGASIQVVIIRNLRVVDILLNL